MRRSIFDPAGTSRVHRNHHLTRTNDANKIVPASIVTISSSDTPMSDVCSQQQDHHENHHEDHRNDDDTTASWQEEAHWMSFHHAIKNFVSLQNPPLEEEKESLDDLLPTTQEQTFPQFASNLASATTPPSIASDLAETKMRLALAQAERDELEFALLQKQSRRDHNSQSV